MRYLVAILTFLVGLVLAPQFLWAQAEPSKVAVDEIELGGQYRFRVQQPGTGLPYEKQLLVMEPLSGNKPFDLWLKPLGTSSHDSVSPACATRLYLAANPFMPARKPALNYIIETGECHLEPGARIAHLSEVWGTEKAMPIQWGFSSFDNGAIWHAMELVAEPSMATPTFRFRGNMAAVDFDLNPALRFIVEKGPRVSGLCSSDQHGRLYIESLSPNGGGDVVKMCLQKSDGYWYWVTVVRAG